MRPARLIVVVAALVALLPAPPASAATNVQIPGLQQALREAGLYRGPLDGLLGPQTRAAVRAFQQREGLAVDGIAGQKTRAALGRLGRPLFGRRVIVRGHVGWDVSVLQFLLHRKGLLTCEIDGRFGELTEQALRRYQQSAGLAVDGVAGPATIAALDPSGVRPPLQQPRPQPQAVRHVVRPGESLTAIAERYGTTVIAIARANGLDPAKVLLVETPLRVPASARSAPPAGQPLSVQVLLDRWARHHGIAPSLLKALAWQESGFQNDVVSPAGAFGVMQITPGTWEFVETVLLGRKVERTVEGNVRVGAAFLAHLLKLFGGNERLALGAYYRGAEAVRRHGLGPETTRYVENVLALRRRM